MKSKKKFSGEARGAVSLTRGRFSGFYCRCAVRYFGEKVPLVECEKPYLALAGDVADSTSSVEEVLMMGRILSPGVTTEGLGGVTSAYLYQWPIKAWRRQVSKNQQFLFERHIFFKSGVAGVSHELFDSYARLHQKLSLLIGSFSARAKTPGMFVFVQRQWRDRLWLQDTLVETFSSPGWSFR